MNKGCHKPPKSRIFTPWRRKNSVKSRMEVRRMPASIPRCEVHEMLVKEQNLNGRAAGEKWLSWQSHEECGISVRNSQMKEKFVTVNQGLPKAYGG